MPRNRKLFIRQKTYFITFRTEEGLPLPPTPVINQILKSVICKAQSQYPVKVSAFSFMANHVHLLITVIDPELVHDFIQYLKRESAHAINRLLGRRKRTIWCCGYDSPIVLDPEKAIEQIAYIYTNPQESNLVDTIEDYPGLSSWGMFITGNHTLKAKRIRRSSIGQLQSGAITLYEYNRIAVDLHRRALEENTFILTPYAWLNSFDTDLSEQEAREQIIARVREKEKEFREARKTPVVGAFKLRTQEMTRAHTPKKYGKRMICLSSYKELRIEYIGFFRSLCSDAYDVYQQVKERICNIFELPPGMFAPGGMLYANVWEAP